MSEFRFSLCQYLVVFVALLGSFDHATAQFAVEVVSYDSGATPQKEFGTNLPFDIEASALGEPARFTGQPPFEGAVTVFNPPFQRSELVSVGEGGHLVLRLSNYVIPQSSGPEIGVFAHAGLIDTDYPNGLVGTPAGAFGIDSAQVDVSADGTNWLSLGNVTFDMPTNGYNDLTSGASSVPGSVPSDFQQPLLANLSDFDGLPYFDAGGPDVVDLLDGSGGGKWLDISTTGLAQVGFVRFSVADNLDPNVGLSFELDAVSIARGAMGAATVPEPSTIILLGLALMALHPARRRQLPVAE